MSGHDPNEGAACVIAEHGKSPITLFYLDSEHSAYRRVRRALWPGPGVEIRIDPSAFPLLYDMRLAVMELEREVARLRLQLEPLADDPLATEVLSSPAASSALKEHSQPAIPDVEGTPPPSAWLPIASAPKDGSKILIAHSFDGSICISYWGCIRGHYGWKSLLHNSESGSRADYCHDIAGWMPLPVPPSSSDALIQEEQK